jgi:hypothetical protein
VITTPSALRALDEDDAIDDRPAELQAADLRAWNALCRVLDSPDDDDARRELEAAKGERERLGELWGDELRARFRREHSGFATAATAPSASAVGARGNDQTGHRFGRRRGVVVATGVASVVSGHVKLDAFVLTEQKLVKPGQVPNLDEQLERLYQLGERYYAARRELEATRAAVFRAADALSAPDHRPLQVAAAAWRATVRPCLDAADALDACSRQLAMLAGLEQVATHVARAADAFTVMLRACDGEHVGGSHPGLDAAMRFLGAMRKLTTRERHATESLTRLRARGVGPNLQSETSVDGRVYHGANHGPAAAERASAALRAKTRRSMLEAGPRDRLLLALQDAANPQAPGAIGTEAIVRMMAPWASVAWLAWCAAGRGESWSSAWDNWPMLDQFQDSTIGAARRAKPAAVKKSRTRNPAR